MTRLEFFVEGQPVPQGSTRSFARNGRQVTTNDPTGRIERWRGDIRTAVRPALPTAWEPLTGPVALGVTFFFARPASHYLPANRSRPERVLRPDAPVWVTGQPDVDKCYRAVLDALTHVVYCDDAQVVSVLPTEKRWATLPGAAITVAEIVE